MYWYGTRINWYYRIVAGACWCVGSQSHWPLHEITRWGTVGPTTNEKFSIPKTVRCRSSRTVWYVICIICDSAAFLSALRQSLSIATAKTRRHSPIDGVLYHLPPVSISDLQSWYIPFFLYTTTFTSSSSKLILSLIYHYLQQGKWLSLLSLLYYIR